MTLLVYCEIVHFFQHKALKWCILSILCVLIFFFSFKNQTTSDVEIMEMFSF